MAKDTEIRARLDSATRDSLQAVADARGEDLSVIVREALRLYLQKIRQSAEIGIGLMPDQFVMQHRIITEEKPIPQNRAAAGSAGGGVARAVDPRTSETPGTSQAPRRRRSSG